MIKDYVSFNGKRLRVIEKVKNLEEGEYKIMRSLVDGNEYALIHIRHWAPNALKDSPRNRLCYGEYVQIKVTPKNKISIIDWLHHSRYKKATQKHQNNYDQHSRFL